MAAGIAATHEQDWTERTTPVVRLGHLLTDPVCQPPIPGHARKSTVCFELGEIAAGALRLAHRALETHAHDLGYQPGAWVERALERARAQLCSDLESRELSLVDEARRCAIALTRAIAATPGDGMLVPGELADALARLLALYLIATTAG
jgi:hypothetical protein